MKHLLCEHQNAVSELKAHGLVSKHLVQEKQEQLQTELHKEMRAVKVNMQELNNETLVKELEVVCSEYYFIKICGLNMSLYLDIMQHLSFNAGNNTLVFISIET